jgi:2-methylcitrate dehydratase PrpD
MSVAAGTAKLMHLSANWKGISPGIIAQRAVYLTALARRCITGPRSIFRGPQRP